MPIVASVVIPVNIHKDRIEILLAEINKCGCLNTKDLAAKVKIPIEEMKTAVDKLVGEKKIACENGVCCADKEQLDNFITKLKALRSN